MKYKQLICAAALIAACTFSANVCAQLEVKTNGDVKVSQNMEVVGNIEVVNNLNVTNDLHVDDLYAADSILADNVKVDNNLTVSNNAQINNNLNVTKNAVIGKKVAIGTNVSNTVCLNIEGTSQTTSPYSGVMSHIKTHTSMPTGPIYALYGYADASESSSSFPIQTIAGVLGRSQKMTGSSAFSVGIAGITHYYGGVGVYGGIDTGGNLLPTTWSIPGCYAGYFNGGVYVNGTLLATAFSTTSDLRQKENVQTIESSLAENIYLLNPVSYTLKQDSVWAYDKEAKELQGVHYGLIAQDVQKIYPELVYERDGKLSINYTELIPMLIKAVQELSNNAEKLKQQILLQDQRIKELELKTSK